MSVLHFVAMHILMYAMVNAVGNAYHNFNQVYMAGLMTASMVLLELPLMKSMYESKRLNTVIMAAGAAALVGFFLLNRQQTLISDRRFLRSMIPHHAGAILMCEQASIEEREIRELCRGIISSQQAEVDLMKAKLDQPAKSARRAHQFGREPLDVGGLRRDGGGGVARRRAARGFAGAPRRGVRFGEDRQTGARPHA
jgi:hypothetical protein